MIEAKGFERSPTSGKSIRVVALELRRLGCLGKGNPRKAAIYEQGKLVGARIR